MEDKLFWFYHKETNEPLETKDSDSHTIMVNSNGDVFYFYNKVITPIPKNYELRFHRKMIKMAGPTLQSMMKECNDCVEDKNVECIWDTWKI